MRNAGVVDAVLRRLRGTDDLREIEEWMVVGDFEEAAARLSGVRPKRIRRIFAALRARRGRADERHVSMPDWARDVESRQNELTADMKSRPPARMLLALLRLRIGEELEAELVALAKRHLSDKRPDPARSSPLHRGECAWLLQDSFLVAVFSSAHADFLEASASGFCEPHVPNIHTSANALCEPDLMCFFDRRNVSGICKASVAMAVLLQRAWSATSRGWDTALAAALKTCSGIRAICLRALITSTTGMHACVHPAARPSWKQRIVARRTLVAAFGSITRQSTATDKEPMLDCAFSVKEAMRRSLAQTMAAHEATRDAMRRTEAACGMLSVPPYSLPSPTTYMSASAFTDACRMICTGVQPVQALVDAFVALSDSHGVSGRRGSGRNGAGSLAKAVFDLSEDCFKTGFAPVWSMCHAQDIRLSRLGASMQRALAMHDVPRTLVASMPAEELLAVQRKAMQVTSAALMPASRVVAHLEIPLLPQRRVFEGGAELPSEIRWLFQNTEPRDAAKAVAFAASARLLERMLVVDLGRDVERMHARALLRRVMCEDDAGLDDPVPKAQAVAPLLRSLVFCTECQRVANAHCDCAPANATDTRSFNEVGVCSSMLMRDPSANGRSVYFCAKRASASVRAAVQMERNMEESIHEAHSGAALATCESLLVHPLPQAACARLRRDSRVCQQQRSSSSACGTQPMAVVPLLGRAVRVLDSWWTMCSLCGVVVRWYPGSYFGTAPCCMRCDSSLVRQGWKLLPPKVERTLCRYCGKPSDATSGAAHRTYKAPFDISGPNATLPPPLRKVSFCAAHQRSWLHAALRQLPSSQILAHIAMSARPQLAQDMPRGETAPSETPAKQKRQRGGKRRRLRKN